MSRAARLASAVLAGGTRRLASAVLAARAACPGAAVLRGRAARIGPAVGAAFAGRFGTPLAASLGLALAALAALPAPLRAQEPAASTTVPGPAATPRDPAGDGDVARAARAAAARLEAASLALARATDASDRVAALTATVRAYEEGLVAVRDGLRRAAVRQARIEADLAARSDEVARLLGVMQVMRPEAAPLLLVHPSGPLGTARAGMMLADVTPAMQARVDALRRDLEEVALLRRLQEEAAETLAEGLAGAQRARAGLTRAMSEREALPRRFAEDAVATAVLIASTETLEAFASGLTDTVGEAFDTPAPDATARRGDLPLPVAGTLLRGYGEADAAGVARPGVILAAPPRALVTTPVAATVRFRGPLLDYGNVIILEPAAGVLFVLAGLAEVFGETGEVLPEGAPVGLLGGEPPSVDTILTESAPPAGGEPRETLYLEVRDGQGAVDPASWFALEQIGTPE